MARQKQEPQHVPDPSTTALNDQEKVEAAMPPARKRTRAQVKAGPPVSPRVLVFVHGAGNFAEGYERPWADEIAQRLGGPIECIGALYGDVTNSRRGPTALAAAPMLPEELTFRAAFQNELKRAYNALPPAERPPSLKAFSLPNVADLVGTITNIVGRYLFVDAIAAQTHKRITAALDQAAQFDEIVLVSHSLGSLIAFDVLRACADRYGKISTWLTLGCPLGKLRRLGIRDSGLGAITRQNVAQWYNVYDTTDIVADAIGPAFPSPGYRLHDIYVDVARDPRGSHDYLQNQETLDLIAAVMR